MPVLAIVVRVGASICMRHEDTGQAALRTAGVYDAFLDLSRPEGQEMREYDHAGTLVAHEDGTEEPARPEIDRTDLRNLLLDGLGPDGVRWNTPVRRVGVVAGGRARLVLGDGAVEDYDLVVGADGAWSRVRAVASGAVPFYTGSTLVETWFTDVDRRYPVLAGMVGNGMMLATEASDPARLLIGQRGGDGSVRVWIGLRCPLDWTGLG